MMRPAKRHYGDDRETILILLVGEYRIFNQTRNLHGVSHGRELQWYSSGLPVFNT